MNVTPNGSKSLLYLSKQKQNQNQNQFHQILKEQMKFILGLFAVAITTWLVGADEPLLRGLLPATDVYGRILNNITSIRIQNSLSTRGPHSTNARAHQGGFLFKIHGHDGKENPSKVVEFFNSNQKPNSEVTAVPYGNPPNASSGLDFAVVLDYRAEWLLNITENGTTVPTRRKFWMKNILVGYSESKRTWYFAASKESDCYGDLDGMFLCPLDEYPTPQKYSACNLDFFQGNTTQLFSFSYSV